MKLLASKIAIRAFLQKVFQRQCQKKPFFNTKAIEKYYLPSFIEVNYSVNYNKKHWKQHLFHPDYSRNYSISSFSEEIKIILKFESFSKLKGQA